MPLPRILLASSAGIAFVLGAIHLAYTALALFLAGVVASRFAGG